MLMFADDGTVEIHEINGAVYNLASGYPVTISSYLGTATFPSLVTAADYIPNNSKLYLFEGDTVYEYDTSGTLPSITFTYFQNFDVTTNDGGSVNIYR